MERSDMRRAGEIILELFRERFGPDFVETARSTSGLFSSWVRIVSEVWPRSFDMDRAVNSRRNDETPAAAVHSRIHELERGILMVEADHPGWIQILRTKQEELLSAAQRLYPELDIRGIAFRLSREPIAPSPPLKSTGDEA